MTRPRTAAGVTIALGVLAAWVLVRGAGAGHGCEPACSTLPLTPVQLLEARPTPGGAVVAFTPSADQPLVSVRVDPRGGGDVLTIEDALAEAREGTIAVAEGTYLVASIVLPPGVSLEGGYDPLTWRRDPVRFVTELHPKDPQSNEARVRLGHGSGLAGVRIRGDLCVDVAGDAAVVEGVLLDHCGTGVLVRSSARAIVSHATFAVNTRGAVLEGGAEASFVRGIFYRNGVGILRLGTDAAPKGLPLPTKNLFFENGTDAVGYASADDVRTDPGFVRVDPVFPPDEDLPSAAAEIVLPTEEIEDREELAITSIATALSENSRLNAVHVEVDLAPGDEAFLLDGERGHVPLLALGSGAHGWFAVPPTASVLLQILTNGDGVFSGEARIVEVGVGRGRDFTPDALDDAPVAGFTGIADARAIRYRARGNAAAPALAADEEERVSYLEGRLRLLVDREGADPVIRGDFGGWEFADAPLPGAAYVDALARPVRTERSVSALLADTGLTDRGELRYVLLAGASGSPAAKNLVTTPRTVTSFRLNGTTVPFSGATYGDLVAAMETALVIRPTQRDEALAYLAATLGEGAVDELAVRRLATFYGAAAGDVRSNDPRILVPLATWLKGELARRNGAAPVYAAVDPERCVVPADCPEHAPSLPPPTEGVPADRGPQRYDATLARRQGTWSAGDLTRAPLSFPATGLLTAPVPVPAAGLAQPGGDARLTFVVPIGRDARTKLQLETIHHPGAEPITVTLRGPVSTTVRLPQASDRPVVATEDLGTFALLAGASVEVEIRATAAAIRALSVTPEAGLAGTFFSALDASDDRLSAKGGSFASGTGWSPEGGLAELLAPTLPAASSRISFRVSGFASCEGGCPASRIATVRLGERAISVRTDGNTLIVGDGSSVRLPLRSASVDVTLMTHLEQERTTVLVAANAERALLVLPTAGGDMRVTLGSSDPLEPLPRGLSYRLLRIIPTALLPSPSHTGAVTAGRRDATAYRIYASSDPEEVRQRRAPATQVAFSQLDDPLAPEASVGDLPNGAPAYLAVDVVGAAGDASPLSGILSVVPSAANGAPPVAQPTFGIGVPGAGLMDVPNVPASRLQPGLGDRLTLDARSSEGSGRLLYSWSFGRDHNIATEERATHTYVDPGTYRASVLLRSAAGDEALLVAPPVTVRGEDGPSLALDLSKAVVAPGEPLTVAGTYRSTDGTPANLEWRVRVDLGNGQELDTTAEAQNAFLRTPSRPLTVVYDRPGSYVIVARLEDVSGAVVATSRATAVVRGPARRTGPPDAFFPGDDVVAVSDTAASAPFDVRYALPGLPADGSWKVIAWNFGDPPSAAEKAALPEAGYASAFQDAGVSVSTPLTTLGELPVFLRVKDETGAVAKTRTDIGVASPDSALDVARGILFGTLPSSLSEFGKSVVIARVAPDGARSTFSTVTVADNGFFFLPLKRDAATSVIAVVREQQRGEEDRELVAVNAAREVRSADAGSVTPAVHGFRATYRGKASAAIVTATFTPDASVLVGTSSSGILLEDLAPGVRLGDYDGSPALRQGLVPLVIFDMDATPRLRDGLTLTAAASADFSPLTVEVRDGEALLARMRLKPDGPVTDVETAEGLSIESAGRAARSIVDPSVELRAGDRLELAVRDANGVLSEPSRSVTLAERDLSVTPSLSFGVASIGAESLLALEDAGKTPFVVNTERPSFFGVTGPGRPVRLTFAGEQPVLLSSDEQGTWSYVADGTFREGPHAVTVDLNGAPVAASFIVDLTPPAAPKVRGIRDGGILEGSAEPRSTLALFVPDEGRLDAVSVDDDGRFEAELLSPGNEVVLKAVDAAGNASPATTYRYAESADGTASRRFPWLHAMLLGIGILGILLVRRYARPFPDTP